MDEEGFLKSNLKNDNKDLVFFAENPQAAIDFINEELK